MKRFLINIFRAIYFSFIRFLRLIISFFILILKRREMFHTLYLTDLWNHFYWTKFRFNYIIIMIKLLFRDLFNLFLWFKYLYYLHIILILFTAYYDILFILFYLLLSLFSWWGDIFCRWWKFFITFNFCLYFFGRFLPLTSRLLSIDRRFYPFWSWRNYNFLKTLRFISLFGLT